jgi:hypothetical protein
MFFLSLKRSIALEEKKKATFSILSTFLCFYLLLSLFYFTSMMFRALMMEYIFVVMRS